MFNSSALLDMHERSHLNLKALLAHCEQLDPEELNVELEGFGYPSVRLQLHHAIGAQKYWIGVLEGRVDVEDDDPLYPTVSHLEDLRQEVYVLTQGYLRDATEGELNTPRSMMTWGQREKTLVPAQVFLRTLTHYYHHQGQVLAMCRLLDKPCHGFDYPVEV